MSAEHMLASFLLSYRMTPQASTGRSPADLFLKRELRNRFSLLRNDLDSKPHTSQQKQKEFHDTRKSVLREFTVGENVRVKSTRDKVIKWFSGKIVKRMGLNTYLVRVGAKMRYVHVDHLLKTGEQDVDIHVPEPE